MLKNYRSHRCYIIAEIGGNFTTLEQAKALIDHAASSGMDAIKLQTYRADTISSREAVFDMENTGVTSQYDLFKKYEISEALQHMVFEYAESKELDWFSTPSHETDVELLEKFSVGAYKIGSDDATNLPFLKFVAERGKPILLSTGMCTLEEVREAVDVIRGAGNRQLSLLHAVTSYPTHPEHVNLGAMVTMMREFPELDIGYSDHTVGTTACICAAALGARILEKHFTYDKHAEGPDHALSADPPEMKAIVDAVRSFEVMRGNGIKEPAGSEATTRINNRKSVVMARAIDAGEPLTQAHLAIKRPGYGIAPKYCDQLVDRVVIRSLKADEVLTWDDLR